MSSPEHLKSTDDGSAQHTSASARTFSQQANFLHRRTNDDVITTTPACEACASERESLSHSSNRSPLIQNCCDHTTHATCTPIDALTLQVSEVSDSPRIQRINSLQEFDDQQPMWCGLEQQVASPMAHFIWTRACLAAFVADGSPLITAAVHHDQFTAVAPMVERRFRGVRRLFLAGVAKLHEPADLIWSNEQSLIQLLDSLVRSRRPVLLERVLAQSPSIDAIDRAFQGRGLVIKRPQAACPYIALDETWLEPEQHLNAGRRSDLRRARRKAEKIGDVTTEIHTPDEKALSQLLEMALDVESKGWKGAARTALIHDAERASFFRQYARAACAEGVLRICFLRIGGNVAAMQLSVEQGGGFWLLKVGYDEQFAACSPGLLLMRDTIRYSAKAGLRSYEFLGMAEKWTAVWTKTEHATLALWIYPFSLGGIWALAVDSAAKLYSKWNTR